LKAGKHFFFEKKAKNFCSLALADETTQTGRYVTTMNKSFLVLFFKKELLASFFASPSSWGTCID